MPLSTVLGAQSLIKPGVCTTATRPASPYTGQMIYDTTTATTLVWNGTAWVGIPTGISTQAEQETATSIITGVSPGRQQYHPSAVKAWIHFNGTGTPAISASYNVASLTDNGTGNYDVNFTVAFSSANYVGVGGSRTGGGAQSITTCRMDAPLQAAGAFGVYVVSPAVPGTLIDASDHQMVFFGDQ